MADARDQKCWSNHAIKDHTIAIPYVECGSIKTMIEETEGVKLVVDLGCGSGLWRSVFYGLNYIGIDQNEDMLSIARGRVEFSVMNTEFIKHNGRNPFTNHRVLNEFIQAKEIDMFWCSAVLQHNRHEPDKDEIVRNVYDALRPGGYFMFTENTFTDYNHDPPFLTWSEGLDDGWSFTIKGWEKFMNDRGFNLVRYIKHSFYLFQKGK